MLLRLWSILMLAVALTCACARHQDDAGSAAADPQGAAQPNQNKTTPSLTAVEHSTEKRQIIRNAALELEVGSPSDVQREASRIAERFGGYVSSSEARGYDGGDLGFVPRSAHMVLRVRSDSLAQALEELKKLGSGVGSESINSDDVTEEYVDIEARLRAQKGLEEQYLEILKTATKVEDALNVQKELSNVRTEIEKLEGRKRSIDGQVRLSTIKLDLSERRPLVTATFSQIWRSIQLALGDIVNVGAAIAIGGIRLLGVMIPVLFLIVLPGLYVLRAIVRRLTARSKPLSAT